MLNEPLREGEVFVGPTTTLTDALFLAFSGLTGDRHPIHHDADYAKRTRFGKPVAHGLLLAALTALGASNKGQRGGSFVFLEQSCRFRKPAFVGDTLTSTLKVERLWGEGERRYCQIGTLLRNQRDETVLEGTHLYRVFDLASNNETSDEHKP